MEYKFREYQGWSAHNTKLQFTLYEGYNCIILYSDSEIDEVSMFGLKALLEYKANIYKGLDVSAIITSGKYNHKKDAIYFSHLSPIFNISQLAENWHRKYLNKDKFAVCIYYTATLRDTNILWKLFNKKKTEVNLITKNGYE